MRKTKIVGSALIGNIVEYYDFGIYAVFTVTIGKLFFPSEDTLSETMMAFFVFALGFMMRPIGGAVFGHIGDKFGRKVALSISIIGMAIATFCIAMLPTYQQIGVAAPILLIIIRLFQGLFIGGEGAGSAVFILEHLQGYRPGLIGSIIMASNMLGTLFAILVGIIINQFFIEDDFSWRYGFMLGGIMGLTGLYLRNHVSETPAFKKIKKMNKEKDLPLLRVIKGKWRRILVISCLSGLATSVAYMIRAYLNVFFLRFMNYSSTDALLLTAFSLIAFVVVLPIFGLLSDRVGYRKFVKIAAWIIILFALPTFHFLSSNDIRIVLLGIVMISMLAASISAPALPYAIQNFSPALRYSGVALSWNLGNALFGGTAPTIATYLTNSFGFQAPAFYIVGLAFLFLFMSYFMRTFKN
jgi:MHS family proline/betaine transporter-like MFS transporter